MTTVLKTVLLVKTKNGNIQGYLFLLFFVACHVIGKFLHENISVACNIVADLFSDKSE